MGNRHTRRRDYKMRRDRDTDEIYAEVEGNIPEWNRSSGVSSFTEKSPSPSASAPGRIKNEIEKLMEVDPDLVPKVPYQYRLIHVRVVDVYDGDTCTVVFLFGNDYMKIKLRIKGIDTPEKRGSSKLEKEAANIVKMEVRGLVLNKICLAKFTNWGKYGGRIIGDLYIPGKESERVTLATYLLDKEYAKSYDGGKKGKWTPEELLKIVDESTPRLN